MLAGAQSGGQDKGASTLTRPGVTTARPPSVRCSISHCLRIRGVRAASELSDGDVGNLSPVNLAHPLLDLRAVGRRGEVKSGPFCRIDADCGRPWTGGSVNWSRTGQWPPWTVRAGRKGSGAEDPWICATAASSS